MLVLARKINETIEIGGGAAAGGVTVMVTRMRRGKTYLGIVAPPNIVVDRGEVAELKRQEREQWEQKRWEREQQSDSEDRQEPPKAA